MVTGTVNGIVRGSKWNLLSVVVNGYRYTVRDARKVYRVGDEIQFKYINTGVEDFYQAQ